MDTAFGITRDWPDWGHFLFGAGVGLYVSALWRTYRR